MFDSLVIKYPLPNKEHNALVYQTKNLARMLDNYEIREDGTLWHERVVREWEENPNSPIGGYLRDVSRKWMPVSDFEGGISFYTSIDDGLGGPSRGWVEYKAVFVDSVLVSVHVVTSTLD